MAQVVVATYNVHAGVDGWGRPFDVVEACRRVDADVLVLQESWAPDGQDSTATRVAAALGYTATELPLARGRIVAPPVDAGRRWGPRLWARSAYGLRLARRGRSSAADRVPGGTGPQLPGRPRDVVRGDWGIAVLSRLPVVRSALVDLGQLPSDPARRGAIVLDVNVNVDVDVAGTPAGLRVVGTHLAHLSQGSPRHLAALRRQLLDTPVAERDGPTPRVLAGDMNMWGPPLSLMLPGWSRAVRGRTWPTWLPRPVAQSDHILVRGGVSVAGGEVVALGGSDHFPVRAVLVI
jgi:endonuclease/exonuclease/phosphatase family metal-dependent hydrolase